MNWSLYWQKKQHTPKALCSWQSFIEIDSFKMFKSNELLQMIKDSTDRLSLWIPQYGLKAILLDDNSLNVAYNGGTYLIPVEKKSCNFGGFYHFFHCPQCDARMRKLYCVEGRYLCRKCANLGYYSQRLRPSVRCLVKKVGIEDFLKSRLGSLDEKPIRMKRHTFLRLKKKCVDYDKQFHDESMKESLSWYGAAWCDDYSPPTNLSDVFDCG